MCEKARVALAVSLFTCVYVRFYLLCVYVRVFLCVWGGECMCEEEGLCVFVCGRMCECMFVNRFINSISSVKQTDVALLTLQWRACHTNEHMLLCTHTHKHTQHTYTHLLTRTFTDTHTHHTYTHLLTRTFTGTYTHTHTQTHTHTHQL